MRPAEELEQASAGVMCAVSAVCLPVDELRKSASRLLRHPRAMIPRARGIVTRKESALNLGSRKLTCFIRVKHSVRTSQ
jgi:hypothetical protein